MLIHFYLVDSEIFLMDLVFLFALTAKKYKPKISSLHLANFGMNFYVLKDPPVLFACLYFLPTLISSFIFSC